MKLLAHLWTLVLLAAACGMAVLEVHAQPSARAERMLDGLALDRPVLVAPLPSDPDRLVIVEQHGRVLAVPREGVEEASRDTLMIDLTAGLPHYADRGQDQLGLLGLAFHPRFAENRQVFLRYTAPRPRRNVVARFTVNDDLTLDPQSQQILIQQRQPYATNNGGSIAFGPDGYLYIAIGDGGSHGDPRNHAQDLSTLLGKVLRIDVDHTDAQRGLPYAIPADNPFGYTPDARPEIYAYGLSNPWRFSFDRDTGDLWLGDVGENHWEEINQIQKGGNYGWRWREGIHTFRETGPGETQPENLIDPAYEYPHTEGKAIVGGYIYRGKAIPELVGQYLYADYETGKVWALKLEDGKPPSNTLLLTIPHPSSFGEDADGELFICSFGENPQQPGDDGVYKLVPITD